MSALAADPIETKQAIARIETISRRGHRVVHSMRRSTRRWRHVRRGDRHAFPIRAARRLAPRHGKVRATVSALAGGAALGSVSARFSASSRRLRRGTSTRV